MDDADTKLLARYALDHHEDAFAEIVRRHLDLVYSAALRQVRAPQLAEDVAQSTFIKLARHAAQLAPTMVQLRARETNQPQGFEIRNISDIPAQGVSWIAEILWDGKVAMTGEPQYKSVCGRDVSIEGEIAPGPLFLYKSNTLVQLAVSVGYIGMLPLGMEYRTRALFSFDPYEHRFIPVASGIE